MGPELARRGVGRLLDEAGDVEWVVVVGITGVLFWTNPMLAACILSPVPFVLGIGAYFWKPFQIPTNAAVGGKAQIDLEFGEWTEGHVLPSQDQALIEVSR